ncbi:GntR family transcriptional regulator [Streptomyces zaomyceticus]|uniref:GntR family transcriptional regulator n=1 Tax=Streptomyces zaomyceticus TaxID=68286 RepID=UPI0035D729F4
MTSEDAWVGEAQPYLGPRPAGETDAWTAEAASRGRRGGQRLLCVEEVEPPPAVREFFGVEPGDSVVVRGRLILLDDAPVELAYSYYPGHIARGTRLADARKIPGGAVTLLATLGYVPEDEPLEDVGPAAADEIQGKTLGVPAGSPVLVLTRFTRSTNGEPMEVSVMTMTRHLQYRQRKQGS